MANKKITPSMVFTLDEVRAIVRGLEMCAAEEHRFAERRKPFPKTSEKLISTCDALVSRFRTMEAYAKHGVAATLAARLAARLFETGEGAKA